MPMRARPSICASLLEIADSAMTYRSRYLNVFQLVPFVDLLLLDEHNPRSCAFQLAAIENHLRELPRITLAQRSDVPRTIAHEMRAAAANAHPARLAFCEARRAARPDRADRHHHLQRRRNCPTPSPTPISSMPAAAAPAPAGAWRL